MRGHPSLEHSSDPKFFQTECSLLSQKRCKANLNIRKMNVYIKVHVEENALVGGVAALR